MLNNPFHISVLHTVGCFEYCHWVDTKRIAICVLLAFKYYTSALLFFICYFIDVPVLNNGGMSSVSRNTGILP